MIKILTSTRSLQLATFKAVQPRIAINQINYKICQCFNNVYNSSSNNRAFGSNAIQELFACGDHHIISLSVGGLCSQYNKVTGETSQLNISDKEKVRSIFMNTLNHTIFIVSVRERRDCSKMKCRALPISQLEGSLTIEDMNIYLLFMKKASKKLFSGFVLKWPDFIEFDELNSKIVTKHSDEHAFRIWSLESYELLYVLKHDQLTEFKICNGIMLLIFSPSGESTIPMTIVNVHNGLPLMDVTYEGPLRDIEFIEQFNEHILVKAKGKALKIQNVITGVVRYVRDFMSPDAFIFIYEKDMFVSLKKGKVYIYSIEGDIITDFGDEKLYSQLPALSISQMHSINSNAPQVPPQGGMDAELQLPYDVSQPIEAPQESQNGGQNDRSYIISLSSSRSFLFTVQKDTNGTVIINVIEIAKGIILAQICTSDSKYTAQMDIITYVHYDESHHEVITGHSDGSILIWY